MIGWPVPLGLEAQRFTIAAACRKAVLLTGMPESEVGWEIGVRSGEEGESERAPRVSRRPPTSPYPLKDQKS